MSKSVCLSVYVAIRRPHAHHVSMHACVRIIQVSKYQHIGHR